MNSSNVLPLKRAVLLKIALCVCNEPEIKHLLDEWNSCRTEDWNKICCKIREKLFTLVFSPMLRNELMGVIESILGKITRRSAYRYVFQTDASEICHVICAGSQEDQQMD
ncbi:hypothetical protein AVEN_220231-1 [Araneus ventricosus]|uniref:Uncharacterized protein n=1 Tax=Araneus ventricosus TaxID=182803 RepID=A0A4Y2UJ25_ARAVE|nr:hypothetical protein AVEN_220231-1 [Araneus ventricosus]